MNITPCNRLGKFTARCGAKTRNNQFCNKFPIKGKRRCNLHGGLSTGPKTEQGRQAIAKANTKHGRYVGKRKKARLQALYRASILEVLDRARRSGLL